MQIGIFLGLDKIYETFEKLSNQKRIRIKKDSNLSYLTNNLMKENDNQDLISIEERKIILEFVNEEKLKDKYSENSVLIQTICIGFIKEKIRQNTMNKFSVDFIMNILNITDTKNFITKSKEVHKNDLMSSLESNANSSDLLKQNLKNFIDLFYFKDLNEGKKI